MLFLYSRSYFVIYPSNAAIGCQKPNKHVDVKSLMVTRNDILE